MGFTARPAADGRTFDSQKVWARGPVGVRFAAGRRQTGGQLEAKGRGFEARWGPFRGWPAADGREPQGVGSGPGGVCFAVGRRQTGGRLEPKGVGSRARGSVSRLAGGRRAGGWESQNAPLGP